jgi:hypothetical protein
MITPLESCVCAEPEAIAMTIQQEEKSKRRLSPAKLIVLNIWFAVTVMLAIYAETAMEFDCTALPPISWAAAFIFVGTITACPVVIGYIFLLKDLRRWLKVVYAVITLILTPIAALITGLFWGLTHMCP